jgi:hypothetical protein
MHIGNNVRQILLQVNVTVLRLIVRRVTQAVVRDIIRRLLLVSVLSRRRRSPRGSLVATSLRSSDQALHFALVCGNLLSELVDLAFLEADDLVEFTFEGCAIGGSSTDARKRAAGKGKKDNVPLIKSASSASFQRWLS